jgi:hypothetical protein
VTRLIQLHGGFDLPLENVKACGQPCASLFVSLIRWGAVASMEIAAQMRGRANFRMYSVGDWQAKRDYAPLRQAIGADYALFVQLRDIWDTTGAAVAKLFAGMHSYFRQVGVACVVSLIDGRMIWCYAESDGWGDLRTAPAAQALVRRLLADLWSPPAAAQE